MAPRNMAPPRLAPASLVPTARAACAKGNFLMASPAQRPAIAFGPVPSRRLGRSLGINNIPPKVCSYSCIYCQAGRTNPLSMERRPFYPPAEVMAAVAARLEEVGQAGERVDFAAFVPDGEPTLDSGLGQEIRGVRELGVPVAVISNGTLLWQEDVRADLAGADWVSVKVDAVEEGTWRSINRPARGLELRRVLQGMAKFATIEGPELVTETMLVSGINDDDRSLQATARFVAGLRPATAYISAPIRPPAESGVRIPEPATFERARRVFRDAGLRVGLLTEDEPDAFSPSEDAESGLLAIVAVHPMHQSAVEQYLAAAGRDWSVVEALVAQGRLVATEHRGIRFYGPPAPRRSGPP
jgi:wyosine [tRNA(Phe)-imidazoG37] synthetase (radical SAM superfamily)